MIAVDVFPGLQAITPLGIQATFAPPTPHDPSDDRHTGDRSTNSLAKAWVATLRNWGRAPIMTSQAPSEASQGAGPTVGPCCDYSAS